MAQYRVYRPLLAGSWGGLFDDFRRDMETLMNRYREGGVPGLAWRGVFPAVNLYETEEDYVLTAELPGVDREQIQVSLEGSTVTLQGERRIEYPAEGASLHRRERQAGTFRRAFELPGAVNADKVEAVHSNGVLLLRLPKSPESKPRQISVRAS